MKNNMKKKMLKKLIIFPYRLQISYEKIPPNKNVKMFHRSFRFNFNKKNIKVYVGNL